MQRFTVYRNEYFRLYPADEFFKFGTTRMARHVHQMSAIGYDFDALLYQQIDDATDRLFVSGNCAGGIDHPIARRECDFRVLIFGNTRKRGARLALTAGTKRNDFVRGQIAISIDGSKILDTFEIAGLTRNLHDAFHGAADDDNFAIGSSCGIRNRTQTRHVRGKCGDCDSAPCDLDEFRDRLCDIQFRRRSTFSHRIGRVADQCETTFLAERAQFLLIGGIT